MDAAPTSFLMTLLPLGQNCVTLVGMFWISLLIHRNLALLSLVVVPFLYYSVSYYSTRIKGRILQVGIKRARRCRSFTRRSPYCESWPPSAGGTTNTSGCATRGSAPTLHAST